MLVCPKTCSSVVVKIEEFEADFKTGGKHSGIHIKVTQTDIDQQEVLLKRYNRPVMDNIDSHFENSLPWMEAFSVFDYMAVPSPADTIYFQEYGEQYISTLTSHCFLGNEADENTILTEKLKAEWGKFKFDLHNWRSKVLQDVKEGKHPA